MLALFVLVRRQLLCLNFGDAIFTAIHITTVFRTFNLNQHLKVISQGNNNIALNLDKYPQNKRK